MASLSANTGAAQTRKVHYHPRLCDYLSLSLCHPVTYTSSFARERACAHAKFHFVDFLPFLLSVHSTRHLSHRNVVRCMRDRNISQLATKACCNIFFFFSKKQTKKTPLLLKHLVCRLDKKPQNSEEKKKKATCANTLH